MSHASRRTVLAGAAVSAAAALSSGVAADPAAARPSRATGPDAVGSTVRYASSFGAVGDGTVDDTDVLQAGVDWSSRTLGTLLLDQGAFAVRHLVLGPQARVVGAGAGLTLFPAGPKPNFAGSTILPLESATRSAPMVEIAAGATGAQLENLAIDGYNFRWGGNPSDPRNWAGRVGLAVRGGVEVRLRSVRVLRFGSTGIEVTALNNARWTDVYVDRCGAPERAAMTIASPPTGATNFTLFDGLTIERSANTALAIAVGDDPVEHWASNLTFTGLHVEANLDQGEQAHPLNTAPLVDVGNVRAVSFIAPHLLGAPAPMVRYRQQIAPDVSVPGAPGGDGRDQQGGLSIIGGQLDQHGGNDARVASVQVTGRGRGVLLHGVKFATLVAPAVRVEPDYGFDASVFACSFRWVGRAAESVDDRRPDETRRLWPNVVDGGFLVRGGDLSVGGRQVRVASRSPVGTTTVEAVDDALVNAGWVDLGARGPGTDTAGRVYCLARHTVSGPVLRVRFERPFPQPPVVLLSPRNGAAVEARFSVDVMPTDDGRSEGFELTANATLQVGGEACLVDYVVIGRE